MKSQPATADRFAANVIDTPVLGATHGEPPPMAVVVDSGLMVLYWRRFSRRKSKIFTIVSFSPSIQNQGSER
jgi:hypothetical protein